MDGLDVDMSDLQELVASMYTMQKRPDRNGDHLTKIPTEIHLSKAQLDTRSADSSQSNEMDCSDGAFLLNGQTEDVTNQRNARVLPSSPYCSQARGCKRESPRFKKERLRSSSLSSILPGMPLQPAIDRLQRESCARTETEFPRFPRAEMGLATDREEDCLFPDDINQLLDNTQTLPVISRLMNDTKSLAVAECLGEGEMRNKLCLSQSCHQLRFPPMPPPLLRCKRTAMERLEADSDPSDSDSGSLSLREQTPETPSETLKTSPDKFMDCVNISEHALSPVGYFTNPSPTSPSPIGRQRSGSQSPYRRTYTSPSTVRLRQSVLGKRKPDDKDEEEEKQDKNKRLCLIPAFLLGKE